MANKKVSEFPVVSQLDNNDYFLINHLGSTSTVSLSTVKTEISNNSVFSLSGATDGQTIVYNGSLSKWIPGTSTGGGGTSLKAWVVFDGTKNIFGQADLTNTNRYIINGNGVSSVVRTGVGAYTVYFTNTLSTSSYAAFLHSDVLGVTNSNFICIPFINTKNTSSLTIRSQSDGGLYNDKSWISVMVLDPNASVNTGGGNTQTTNSVVVLEDRKTLGTSGGTPLSANTWLTRDLNTKVSDSSNLCTLSNNRFVLPAGTYTINANAPAYVVNEHQIRLQNITDNATTCTGTSEFTWNGNTSQVQTRSSINGIFTITAAKTFEIQHHIRTIATNGLGYPCGSAGQRTTEVYTTVFLTKIA